MAAAKKEEKKSIKTGASSGHITNLKQAILETLDIYGNGKNEVFWIQLIFQIKAEVKE